jgi:hypothetical protein
MSGRVTPKKTQRCQWPEDGECPHRGDRRVGVCSCCGEPMVVCGTHYVAFLEAYAEGRLQLDGLILDLGGTR